jgi:signal transduction histidine kinase
MFQGKMMVVAQGGKIEVESEARKGSTFRVLLASDKQVR